MGVPVFRGSCRWLRTDEMEFFLRTKMYSFTTAV